MIKAATEEICYVYDARHAELEFDILGAADRRFASDSCRFLSQTGDDHADGCTPQTAWKSCNRLERENLPAGSVVRFARGGTFRGGFRAREGITYAAYGNGPKPRIIGSPYDGAKTGDWTEVYPHVYRYSLKLYEDCGLLVFDDGKQHARKITLHYGKRPVVNYITGQIFEGPQSLEEDLTFWHDLGGAETRSGADGYLYLCSTMGNPAERFHEIEFLVRRNIITVCGNNVRIENLLLQYGGAHGIGGGTTENLTVSNCIFQWIGGSVQYYANEGYPVRFGNGVELYGGCQGYTVDHCWFHQIYDAGITFQFSQGGREDILMENVRFTNNLTELCTYSIEYFLGKAIDSRVTRRIHDVVIRDNLLLDAGRGFGGQRPDKGEAAHIKAWDHENRSDGSIRIEQNLMAGSNDMMLHIGMGDPTYSPIVRGNTFIQKKGGQFARYGVIPTQMYTYSAKSIPEALRDNRFFASF